MEEEWRPVVGFPEYEVSNLGRVKSNKRNTNGLKGGFLKLCDVKKHTYVHLCKEGIKYKIAKVHRLVAEAFLPNPEDREIVCHISKDQTDNRVENLRWATAEEEQTLFRRKPILERRPRVNGKHQIPITGQPHIYELGCRWRVVVEEKAKICYSLEEAIKVRDEFLDSLQVNLTPVNLTG